MADTQIPSTITEQVEEIKNLEISYRVLHPFADMYDESTNRNILFPFSSVITKYKDFLYNIITTVTLNEAEQLYYQFKPKLLSEDLYDTTELWDTLLILNNYVSVSEFKPKVLKVYDPERFKEYINEILLLEEEAGNITL